MADSLMDRNFLFSQPSVPRILIPAPRLQETLESPYTGPVPRLRGTSGITSDSRRPRAPPSLIPGTLHPGPAPSWLATGCLAAYRARPPRATPLYRLFDAHFDEGKGQWEERSERRFGFWRGFVDEQVLRYLDCGLYENGFARIRCPDCAEEYLLAFSCKTRELCPSCAAKGAATTAALLAGDVLEEVGHAQWVFVIPKMLHPYFLRHRELLGGLARAGWETVLELIVAAVDDETFRPGMVAVVQTAGDMANWQPHLHALVSRGGWAAGGEWSPVPFVDELSAELLFRSTRLIRWCVRRAGSEMKVIAFIIDHAVVDEVFAAPRARGGRASARAARAIRACSGVVNSSPDSRVWVPG